MVYIVGTLLRKALEKHEILQDRDLSVEEVWKHLMLLPVDYTEKAIYNEITRSLMDKIVFEHGGDYYDEKYPEGIPTSVHLTTSDDVTYESGFIMFPAGHASNTTVDLTHLLQHKMKMLGSMAMEKERLVSWVNRLETIQNQTNEELQSIYDCNIQFADIPIDHSLSEDEEDEEPSKDDE
jgi:2-methylcitrate dehydratase